MLLKELARQYEESKGPVPKRAKVVVDDTIYHRGEIESLPDFILVYKTSKVTLRSIALMEEFLLNLEDVGIMYDTSIFSVNNDVVFIKLYAPTSILYYCADLYFIELACNSADFKPPVTVPYWQFMTNELTNPTFNGVVHRRAPHCLNITKPKSITRAERILILYTILMNTKFGDGRYDYGVEKLVSRGIFECTFPLHDGSHEWTDTGTLNERQLLKKYWSSFRCFNKTQPLDMIHHYFGAQTAFYFAWMGFYNQMLISASVAGILCFILGLILFSKNVEDIREQICNSKLKLCPKCITKHCIYQELRHSCWSATYSYAFDNPMTFTFAVFMTFWAAFVMRMWKRKETILMMKWDLRSLEIDTSMRYGYLEKATKREISPVTGEEEPYVPKLTKVACFTFTLSVMICLVIFNVICIFIIMLLSFYLSIIIIKYGQVESLRERSSAISGLTGAAASGIFVKVYSLSYHKITWWLTNMENPRSQIDFDNSYILKLYILAFVNNYSTVFYIAFFKGAFYSHPGDSKIYEEFFGIATDTCDPFGCTPNLAMYMVIAMLVKRTLWMNARKLLITLLHKIFGRMQVHKSLKPAKLNFDKQWEMAYLLRPITKLDIIEEYLDIAIQYGYVTFFVACFPFAPVLALFNNLIELRVDATRRLVMYRRTIPFKVMGLGAWNVIFQAATFIGVITNALVIVFTSDFIAKEMYRHRYHSLKGFVNFTLSLFDTNDFVDADFNYKTEPFCFYAGHRYDPGHSQKYQRNTFYWSVFTYRFIFIVVFEHILLALSGLLAFLIPAMPFSVKQLVSKQEEHYKNLRIAEAEEQARMDDRRSPSVLSSSPSARHRTQNHSYFSRTSLSSM